MAWVHNCIVHNAKESVKPESLLFMLYQANFARSAFRLCTSSGAGNLQLRARANAGRTAT